MNRKSGLPLLCLTAILLGIGCSGNAPVTGTEIRNGNCVGKIYNRDGSAADSVVVRLIPIDYNPYLKAGRSIDSTLTNAQGDYTFNVTESKLYNIVAEKGPASSLRASILLQIETQTRVKNDTLRESGRLSGVVRLKPGDDSRQVIILILGTNIYMVPSDSTGGFTSPLLPQGNYTLQTFTAMPDYSVFDTLVNVQSGTETSASIILPSSNAPPIEQFSATYDSATMVVSLVWKMSDTSKVVSYALYRKTAQGHDTMFLIDKSVTSFTDDVIGFDGDTVSYRIAGIGTNDKEGYDCKTPPVIACGLVYCTKKTDLSSIAAGLPSMENASVFSDRENEIFLYGNDGIYKMDSNGVVQNDYRLDDPEQNYSLENLQSDDAGHLYISKNCGYLITDSLFNIYGEYNVVRFDRDLKERSQLTIYKGTTGMTKQGGGDPFLALPSVTFMVTARGELYTFEGRREQWSTDVIVYDSTFGAIDSFKVAERIVNSGRQFGDSLITVDIHREQPVDVLPYIHFYDKEFIPVSTIHPTDACPAAWADPRFKTFKDLQKFYPAGNNIFVSVFLSGEFGDSSLLQFTTSKGNLLARIVVPVPASQDFFFDARGTMYFISYNQKCTSTEECINTLTTLFTYTLRPLWKKNGR